MKASTVLLHLETCMKDGAGLNFTGFFYGSKFIDDETRFFKA